MSENSCGCCACLAGAGHVAGVTNRPGRSAIRYRVGAYGTFFDAMIRRLTVPGEEQQMSVAYSLHALKTRESDDPAIALLDAWATVGDVLTFYQERIANEAFLRTATERRSVLELGRLVGYKLKPGVSASVYLAYTLDETATTIIPSGTKAQSIPGANEQPQMFETSEDIEARGAWNALRPRMSRPQEIKIDDVRETDHVLRIRSLWIEGTTTQLNARDPLLFVFAKDKQPIYALRRALGINVDLEQKRTEIVLEPIRLYYLELAEFVRKELAKPSPGMLAARKPRRRKGAAAQDVDSDRQKSLKAFLQHLLLGVPRTSLIGIANEYKLEDIAIKLERSDDQDHDEQVATTSDRDKCGIEELFKPLVKPPGPVPPTQWQFERSLEQSIGHRSDYIPRLLTAFHPQLQHTLYTAIANNACGDKPYAEFRSVHVMRRLGAVFGYNAPTVLFEDRPNPTSRLVTHSQNTLPISTPPQPLPQLPVPAFVLENDRVLNLDTPDETIPVGSYVVTQNLSGTYVAKVLNAETLPRTAYGVSGKTTRLGLNREWSLPAFETRQTDGQGKDIAIDSMIVNLRTIRSTAVLAKSEELMLAQQPVDRAIGLEADAHDPDSESPTRVELDSVVDGLVPGRWIIVSGERFDTTHTSGVVSSELAMIDNVEHQISPGPGGTAYSVLVLAPAGLTYQYKRATLRISANVVGATNGETRSEILGAGNAAQPMQEFTLHQSPLTFVSAPTVTGVNSTLVVRINEVHWHQTDSLAEALPADRVFATKTAEDGKVSVIFGSGQAGARLPTGPDNVRAVYRSGMGRGGNVRAGQVATAISRPLGVRDVVNPLAASGGADPESRDDARRNIPVSLQAMGRVVSVPDYADFARTFAGISKASAVALSDGRGRFVHLTIGGAGDIDIDVNSDLYRNLREALRKYGDPYQPFVVELRGKIVMMGAARVRVHSDHLWANVAPKVRAALVDTFSYDRRDFAQPIYPAEVVAAIQNVSGVVNVDLDELRGITSTQAAALAKAANASMDPMDRMPFLVRPRELLPIIPRLAHYPKEAPKTLQPAEVAYLPPELAELFILTEIVDD
jgi:Baseplate J-like protein